MNFPLINIDLTKGGTVDAMNATSPHSASSDSGSDTDDDQKPPVSDKPNSQVSLRAVIALPVFLTVSSGCLPGSPNRLFRLTLLDS